MRRLSSLLPLAVLALLVSGRAAHAEPARFAIMGVRLYMTAEDVLTSLYAQGVKPDAVRETVHPCALHAAVACTTRIVAPLPDGTLDVAFTDSPPGFNEGREAAIAVSYHLNRGLPDLGTVRLSAEERFGALDSGAEGTWCARPAGGPCPADQPRMTVTKDASGTATLAISDLGLTARLLATSGG